MSSDVQLANALRVLSMDAVEKAQSGHPGMPLGMADIAQVLWRSFLQHNPSDPNWPNRDRFVLSNGHGSMLLYAVLHLTGYALSIDDLKKFRVLHSKTPGHPEYGVTPGVETTTGPLGQGLANAVGMSLAEKLTATTFNRPDHSIVDHYTYCFVGDGCLMEGISHEASSLAGTLGLGKLIVFWDDNGISIDGKIVDWCKDDTLQRFTAYGWQVQTIDGHDTEAIQSAIQVAQSETDKPSLIACKTTIGYGTLVANQAKAHGAPLGAATIAAARRELDWPYPPFEIPEDVQHAWDATAQGQQVEKEWQEKFSLYAKAYPELAQEFTRRQKGEVSKDVIDKIHQLAAEFPDENIATRKASQRVLEVLVKEMPELLGGSADLSESNATFCSHSKSIERKHFAGNYLHYGVREFGMSAIMNGLALYGGFIPYGGTFLTFLDYARNAVRLSALMKQRVIFVYTHDSVALGEDGPTHQPIEHLSSLRIMPNMSVWRPCDGSEAAIAWSCGLQRTSGPTSLVLSRQKTVHQKRTPIQIKNIAKGGYILLDCEKTIDILLMATGSEVEIAMQAAKVLTEKGFQVRVVSFPSVDVFMAQDLDYQQEVLPPKVKARVAIEAGVTNYWYQWVGLEGAVVGIDRYGESAPGSIVLGSLGMTVENIITVSEKLLAKEGHTNDS